MPEYAIFIPAFTFAHLLGLALLLYSLEKVSGVVSKTWNRLAGRIKNGGRTDDADQLDRKASADGAASGPTIELEASASKARTASWKRGCSCEVGPYKEAWGHAIGGLQVLARAPLRPLPSRGIEVAKHIKQPYSGRRCLPSFAEALILEYLRPTACGHGGLGHLPFNWANVLSRNFQDVASQNLLT